MVICLTSQWVIFILQCRRIQCSGRGSNAIKYHPFLLSSGRPWNRLFLSGFYSKGDIFNGLLMWCQKTFLFSWNLHRWCYHEKIKGKVPVCIGMPCSAASLNVLVRRAWGDGSDSVKKSIGMLLPGLSGTKMASNWAPSAECAAVPPAFVLYDPLPLYLTGRYFKRFDLLCGLFMEVMDKPS